MVNHSQFQTLQKHSLRNYAKEMVRILVDGRNGAVEVVLVEAHQDRAEDFLGVAVHILGHVSCLWRASTRAPESGVLRRSVTG